MKKRGENTLIINGLNSHSQIEWGCRRVSHYNIALNKKLGKKLKTIAIGPKADKSGES